MLTNQNQNTLKSWATGKVASLALGLAVGGFIYYSGIIPQLIDRFTKKEPKPN